MKFKEYGFGMFGWVNNRIGIIGGLRDDGFHPVGKMRCRFDIYDKQTAEHPVGKAVLVINLADDDKPEPTVDKLIKIEIEKRFRKQGIGRLAVAAMMEAAEGDLEICDIKKPAMGFWKKVGAEGFKNNGKQVNATIPKTTKNDLKIESTEPNMATAPAM